MNNTENPKEDKEEKGLLLDHDFDGIQELDNAIPRWFMYLFVITIFICVFYVFHYHFFKQGPNQDEEYAMEMAAAAAADSSRANPVEMIVLNDPASLEAGKKLFQDKLCYSCHGNSGEGNVIGPNLTDVYWIHGGKFEDILKLITSGVPQKGMAPFGDQLSEKAIHQVASFVLSLQGSNPPNARDPQGEKAE